MTTTTKNFYIAPSDGWVQIAPTASKFIRTSAYPHTHPYYLAFSASAPSLVGVAGSGSAAFSGGVPTNGQDIAIGPETYFFKTTPVNPNDVQIHAATPGVGTVTFTGLPTANQTVVIGTETYTFKALASNPFEVTIGANATTTATNFVASVVAAPSTLITATSALGVVTVTSILQSATGNYTYSTSATNTGVGGATLLGGQDGSLVTATNFTAIVNAQSAIVTASDTSGTVTLTSKLVGEFSNYPLTKTASHVTLTAFSGGLDASAGILIVHKPFWVNITTDEPLWARVINTVPNANNTTGALRVDVASIQ